MSYFPSNQARLLDPDAHCIKFISTYSYDVCIEKLETVMNEMALGRLSANLLRIRSCMNITTHLKYRLLTLSDKVNAEDHQFMTEYESFYKFYLDQRSSNGNASHNDIPSMKKTRHCYQGCELKDEYLVSDLKSSDSSIVSGVPSTSLTAPCIASNSSGATFVKNVTSSVTLAVSPSVVIPCGTNPEELETCDFMDCNSYCNLCSCSKLNIPSVFHVDCIDLSTLLEPFEPFSYRNEFGDHIEVYSPQKLIGLKRSQPETFSVDEMISICDSACRPADSTFSTRNFVDWRELLSWASYTLRRSS